MSVNKAVAKDPTYDQTLGFKLLRDNRDIVWPDYVATQFGLRRAQGRGALLALGEEEHHTRLDLIEWIEPSADERGFSWERNNVR